MYPTIICLMGPTASGKTALSLRLAKDLNAEIISVDSAMVYRGFDIGTAKPSRELQKEVPHHLIDICNPTDPYSVAQFLKDANHAITSVLARNKLPLLVGGTMLYFNALQKGLAPLPGANEQVRKQLTEEAEQIGWQGMHEKLAVIDSESANRIYSTDSQRIQRALEVYLLTGNTLSSLWQATFDEPKYSFVNIALWPEDRQLLHDRIALRFKDMLAAGFLEEVEQLFNRGDLHPDLPAIRSVGYRQTWEYLQGNHTYEEMENKAIAATRQLAKRQLTWLRHFRPITYFESSDSLLTEKLLQHLKNLGINL